MIKRYIINKEGYRIKRYLEEEGLPDQVFKEIRNGNGQYLVNDQICDGHFLLQVGDLLEVVMPASDQGDNIVSTYGDFEIIYEDSYLLIINKEAGIATIPTKEYFTNSLANYVMSYYKRNGILSNIHFVSRLDAPTSGLIMLGKSGYITTLLQNTDITKKYLLETKDLVSPLDDTIELGILKDSDSVIKRYTTDEFINSKTIYKTIYQEKNHSFIEALLCTGKTHQLRLHFKSKGTSIVGDKLYGEETEDGILHLHSYHLEFIHPITKKRIVLETYPDWFDVSKLKVE